MGRYEDYQNLIDAKILQGTQWSAVLEREYDTDEEKYFLNTSFNKIKALKEANTNVMLHIIDQNGSDQADLYIPLQVLYAQPSTTPAIYGVYFSGVEDHEYTAADPNSNLYQS